MTKTFAAVVLAVAAAPAVAADWAQFKGPNAAGVSDEKGLPVEWGKDKGIRWKTALPARGVSCPVVVGNRVYVTCASGKRDDQLHVLAFDATTGRELWRRQLLATGPTSCHPKSSMAAPTPVADETGVYALFASGDLAAFDADGTLRWYRSLVGDYPTITNQVGMASSPVLVGDKLIVPMDNDGESFLAAVDTRYGKNVWKAARPKGINWVTPLVREAGGVTEVLFAGPSGTTAYDAATGQQRWVYKEAPGNIPTASLADGLLYYPAGGVSAVRLGEAGVEGKPVMTSRLARPGMASPLVYGGKVFTVDGQGFVTAVEAKTGKLLYKERTKLGEASASPVAGDGKVYVTSEKGVTLVIPADKDTFDPLATNDLGEEVLGTPAISGGSLFIRTDKHLYRIGK
ncbi:MAG: PQQ-binding-like beta-propeller repeat protein [Gemmataceae bacterium]|nr:PQQ-binding-like beta-propeller repeat protein [Gemmataceae bacterium]